jgi:hypothetical protein
LRRADGATVASAVERDESLREGSVNREAASEYPVSEESRSQLVRLTIAELSADEAVPRVSRLTALIVMVAASLGTWAVIWAALASLYGS